MPRRPNARKLFRAAFAFFAGVVTASNAWALDPSRRLSQYVQAVWRMEEGLPHNTVRAILQTRDGYMWLGTYGGLVRFDGVRFRVFDNRNSGLRDNEVRALAEDNEGNLWVGTTAGGLHRMSHGKLEPFDNGIDNRTINALQMGSDGSLWIGSSDGLYVLRRGKMRRFGKESGLDRPYVNALSVSGGETWIGTPGGLYRLANERAERVRLPNIPESDVWSVFNDSEGRLWVGLVTNLLQIVPDGKSATVTITRSWSLPHVWGWIVSLLEDRDKNIWIGTYGGGLYRIANGTMDRISSDSGFIDYRPWGLWEDREGSLWVGTRAGLARMKNGPATTFAAAEGLPGDLTRAVMEDRDGTIWIGTAQGAARYRDGRITSYTRKDGLPHEIVRGFLRDRRGRLWVNGVGGIVQLDEVRGRFGNFIGTSEGLPWPVRLMIEDRAGRTWVGTDRGMVVAEKGLGESVLKALPELSDIEPQSIEGLYEDREGGIWIGTFSAGLRRWLNGRVENPTLLGGASIGVRSFYEDADGTMYVGTIGAGLFVRRKGQGFRQITTRDGLTDDAIWSVLQDGDALWMSSDRGVLKLSRTQLLDFVDGRASSVVVSRLIGTQDGMKSRECNGGGGLAGLIARDGRLWFPTAKGAVVIDPKHLNAAQPAPPVMIEEAVIDRDPQPESREVTVEAGRRDVEIHYTGLSFVDSARLRFRYQLEKYDAGWVDAGERRVAYFSSLPPGDFRFRVQASNRDDIWNHEGAEMLLHVKPRFVQTPLFRGLAFLAVLTLITGFLTLRTRQLHARAEELRNLVATRTAELEKANSQLARLAAVDDLTGIPNHRRFTAFLEQEWLRCQRGRQPLSLLLCDIDDFKAYNDTHGHQAGDACLTRVAQALAETVQRVTDLAARYGGEEFVVVLPSTDEGGALAVAESIQAAIHALRLEHGASRAAPHVTLSIGCATNRPQPGAKDDVAGLIADADRALYRAKDQGRNCIVSA